jgi:hypothetical protein
MDMLGWKGWRSFESAFTSLVSFQPFLTFVFDSQESLHPLALSHARLQAVNVPHGFVVLSKEELALLKPWTWQGLYSSVENEPQSSMARNSMEDYAAMWIHPPAAGHHIGMLVVFQGLPASESNPLSSSEVFYCDGCTSCKW